MAGYNVEASFMIDSKQAEKALTSIFGKLEKIELKLKDVTTMFGTMAKSINTLSISAASSGDMFKILNTELSGTNTRLTNMADRLPKTTMQMADMGAEADYVSNAMGILAKQTASAGAAAAAARSQFRGFGMGGMGGGGGGGGRSHGQMGVGAGMKVGALGAFGLAKGAGHFAMNAVNAGFMAMLGIDIAKEGLNPSLEYQQVKTSMQMMGGFSAGDIKKAEQAAQKTSAAVPTTTLTENLRTYKELYAIFAHKDMAAATLPMMAKLQTVLAAASGEMPDLKGKESGVALSVAKSAEMLGLAQSDEQFKAFAPKLAKMYIASGGLTRPEAFQKFIGIMRGSKFGKEDEFMFPVISHFISESASGRGMGATRGGSMFASLQRMLGGGVMTKTTATALQNLDLFPTTGKDGKPIKLDNATIHALMGHGALKGNAEFLKNPFEWANKYLKTAIEDKEHLGRGGFNKLEQAKQAQLMNKYMGSTPGTALDALMQFVISEKQIRKQIELYKQVPDLEENYNRSLGTTGMKLEAVSAQFNSLLTVMGKSPYIMGPLNVALDTLVGGLKGMTTWTSNLDKDVRTLLQLNPALDQFGKALTDLTAKTLGALSWITQFDPKDDFATQRRKAMLMMGGAGALAGAGIGSLFGPAVPVTVPLGAALGFTAGVLGVAGATRQGGSQVDTLNKMKRQHPAAFAGASRHPGNELDSSGKPMLPGGITVNNNVTVHGDPHPDRIKKLKDAIEHGTSSALMKRGLISQSTIGTAGGNFNTPGWANGAVIG